MQNEQMIRTASHLEFRDIIDLADGLILAIKIPCFFPQEACSDMKARILNALESGESRTFEKRNIAYIGASISDFHEKEGIKPGRIAFNYPPPGARILRDLFSPYASPVDLIRTSLDDAWPAGSTIAKPFGKPFPAGIVRCWNQGEVLEQHQDPTPDEIFGEYGIDTVFAANTYIDVPTDNGYLSLWDAGYDSRSYSKIRKQISGGIQDEYQLKSRPKAKIKPVIGDLILICAGRVHSVFNDDSAQRITASCFVGLAGPAKPLVVWS